jgi:hypothetical protein
MLYINYIVNQTIFQMAAREILDAFAKSARFKINNEYNRKEIQEFMRTIPNAGLQNPTALTYNQWNCGMTFICPLFEIINWGTYLYLGAGYNYTGDCYNIKKGINRKIKIGSWKNGEFNFLDNTIESFLEWKVKNCQNQNQKEHKKDKLNDREEDVKSTEIFAVENELMKNFGFVSIGVYFKNSNNEPFCRFNVKKSDIKSLVYALVVENEIKYIGKTIRGYSRPLSYLKNDVMVNVKEGILNSLKDNRKVHVLVKSENLIYTMEGLDIDIDIAEGYEQALISKFKPEWNNHIRELPNSSGIK